MSKNTDIDIKQIKQLLSDGKRSSISTKTFEKLLDLLEYKEKEIAKWKNAHDVSQDALTESEQYVEELESKLEDLKNKQKPLQVKKSLYDSYCEIKCRANDIAIDLAKEFNFMSQQQIIPTISEGIRILRFQRDKYKQTLDVILQHIDNSCYKYGRKCNFQYSCSECDRIGNDVILPKIEDKIHELNKGK